MLSCIVVTFSIIHYECRDSGTSMLSTPVSSHGGKEYFLRNVSQCIVALRNATAVIAAYRRYTLCAIAIRFVLFYVVDIYIYTMRQIYCV